jgi:hypothetical protein
VRDWLRRPLFLTFFLVSPEELRKDRHFLEELVEHQSLATVAHAFVNHRQVGLLLDDFLVQHGIPDPGLQQAAPRLTLAETNLLQRLASLTRVDRNNIDRQALHSLRVIFEAGGFYYGSNIVTPNSSPANRPGPQNQKGGGAGGAAPVPP